MDQELVENFLAGVGVTGHFHTEGRGLKQCPKDLSWAPYFSTGARDKQQSGKGNAKTSRFVSERGLLLLMFTRRCSEACKALCRTWNL